MNQSLVAVRYAKALFKLVKEKELMEKVNSDLVLVKELFKSSAELKDFINSPLYNTSAKKKAINKIIGLRIEPVTLLFLNMVIEKKREVLLPAIIYNYQDFYRKERNIKQVIFLSASKLEPKFYIALKHQLQTTFNATIDLTIEEKKELLGGFVLMVDGKLMDASISNQLKQIQKQLLS